jgi:hypothetical protein
MQELNAEKEEEKLADDLIDNKRPVFDQKDFYNQETLAIAVDYLQLVRLARAN